MNRGFLILAAPLQGYTEAAWRRAHAEVFGGVDAYFTPFVRIERGEVRGRDLRDALSPLNEGVTVIPQVIFKDTEELRTMVAKLVGAGAKRIDLNMGCPFPPQMGRGRGAGIVGDAKRLAKMAEYLERYPEIDFSVKMRLGAEHPYEWKVAMPVLNRMPLSHVTLHPRTGRQQYKGEPDMEAFAEFMIQSEHPVIFNGDVKSSERVVELKAHYPGIAGVMLGRGLLERPWLAGEIRQEKIFSVEELIKKVLSLYAAVADQWDKTLCGDAQKLMKLKTFWDYPGTLLPKKIAKQIAKANSLTSFDRAIAAARLWADSL